MYLIDVIAEDILRELSRTTCYGSVTWTVTVRESKPEDTHDRDDYYNITVIASLGGYDVRLQFNKEEDEIELNVILQNNELAGRTFGPQDWLHSEAWDLCDLILMGEEMSPEDRARECIEFQRFSRLLTQRAESGCRVATWKKSES